MSVRVHVPACFWTMHRIAEEHFGYIEPPPGMRASSDSIHFKPLHSSFQSTAFEPEQAFALRGSADETSKIFIPAIFHASHAAAMSDRKRSCSVRRAKNPYARLTDRHQQKEGIKQAVNRQFCSIMVCVRPENSPCNWQAARCVRTVDGEPALCLLLSSCFALQSWSKLC